jgi:hypothetical protein
MAMDSNTLKVLEEKYWAGKTSLEEERFLKSAAAQGQSGLSNELKGLLGSVESAFDHELGPDFDKAFWNRVETPVIKRPFILQFASVLKYAAAIAIAVGIAAVVWSLVNSSESDLVNTSAEISAVDTYDDPEKAFEEAKKALALASEKFNKGAKPMGEIKRFHTTQMSIAGSANNDDTDN